MNSINSKSIPMTLDVVPVYGSTGDEQRGEGQVTIEHFRPDQILLNAFKKLGICWLAAIFSIFIPVLHFVLVPAFFILGIYLFRRSFKAKARIIRGEISCPKCRQAIAVSPGSLMWPITEICQGCVNTVRIYANTP